MDNSATKTQQNGSDQPVVLPASGQNAAGTSTADANADNNTKRPVVVNRGGIQVDLSTSKTKDSGVVQDDLSSVKPVLLQNSSSSLLEKSITSQAVPAVQPDPKPQEPQVPQQPVSSPRSKEQEPVSAPLPDVAKMSEAEIVEEEKVVEKELESMIEKSPDHEKPEISKDIQDAGVELAGPDLDHPITPSGSVSLPMSYDEAEFTKKKYKWRSSVAWLAALIMYHWKKIKVATPSNTKKED